MNDVLPRDSKIPALEAVAERGLEAAVRAAGVEGAPTEIELLKYHPRTRCTFRLVVGGREVACKAYAHDPEPLVTLLGRLEGEGLASGNPPTVAPLVAFDPTLRLIVTAWLSGPTGKELISAGAGSRAGELAAAWLRAADRVEVDVGEQYGPSALLADTARRVEVLTGADETLGGLAAAELAALATDRPAERTRGVRHPSFKPSSILDLGEGPGLIDWDGFSQGAPELEAGMFLASLTRMAGGRRPRGAELAEAERAFRAGVRDLLDLSAVSWYEAAALVKLAARLARRQPDRWWERAHRLLRRAESILAQRV